MEKTAILQLVKDLRKRYFDNKKNITIDSEMKDWLDIQRICKNYNINEDIIIMDEHVFLKMVEKNIVEDFLFK